MCRAPRSDRHPPLRSTEERNALVVQYRNLVHHVVRRLYGARCAPELYEDAVQYGLLALMRAAELWDPRRHSRGRPVTFLTYAFRSIRQCVIRDMLAAGLVHVPAHARQREAAPRFREAAGHADRVCRLPDGFDLDGGHRPPGQSDREDEALADAWRFLHPTQQQVLRLRFWERLTLTEVALRLGYRSRERVRQVQSDALAKLRQRMGVPEPATRRTLVIGRPRVKVAP